METKVEKITQQSLSFAKKCIQDGQLVAFPTETVYGLGGDATNDEAVKKIFLAKGRPQDNPLIVHIDSFSKAYQIAEDIPKKAEMLAKAFMPGAITIVLKKKSIISDLVSCGLDTVGVRVPSDKNAREFLSFVGCPIAAPSANTSKRPSPTSAIHVYDDLQGKIPLILDGGDCSVGIESTVIDLSLETPAILRPGIITKSQIENVIGEVLVSMGTEDKVHSPGVKYTHYSPKCDMFLFKDIDNAKKSYDSESIILAFDNSLSALNGYTVASLGGDNKAASNRFYALLRLYENSYKRILCQYPSQDEIGLSLINRMIKSAGNKFI